MSAIRREVSQRKLFQWRDLLLAMSLFSFASAPPLFGQGRTNSVVRDYAPQEVHFHQAAIPLKDLLNEAEHNNPQIAAARQDWEAAKQMPSQVSTLPDPQFTAQQVNVGSPRPFAGYTNSDFAYVGLGVSQDFPYPGKLGLRGEMAKRDADVA